AALAAELRARRVRRAARRAGLHQGRAALGAELAARLVLGSTSGTEHGSSRLAGRVTGYCPPFDSYREACGAVVLRSAGRDVLVQPEEVVGIVVSLQGLQPVVPRGSVRLPDAVLALIHQEVHVHARVVRLERRPEAPGPLAFLVESVGGLRRRVDVDG